MKVSKLTGKDLDNWVAKAIGYYDDERDLKWRVEP